MYLNTSNGTSLAQLGRRYNEAFAYREVSKDQIVCHFPLYMGNCGGVFVYVGVGIVINTHASWHLSLPLLDFGTY